MISDDHAIWTEVPTELVITGLVAFEGTSAARISP